MLICQACFSDTALPYPASVQRPVPTEEMIERRNQILNMEYGERSVGFLLEEGKLRKCGLLGKTESTDDWLFPNYPHWEQVPVPCKLQRAKLVSPSRALKKSLSEGASTEHQSSGNFSTRPNPNPVTHRPEQRPRSPQVKYSTDETVEISIDQYGSNELEDLSQIKIGVGSSLSLSSASDHGHAYSVSPHFPSQDHFLLYIELICCLHMV